MTMGRFSNQGLRGKDIHPVKRCQNYARRMYESTCENWNAGTLERFWAMTLGTA